MRKATPGIALLLLTVIAWFGSQGKPPRTADSTKPALQPATQKLEYLRRYWTSFGTDATGLNALGAQGWEVCGVVPGTSSTDREVIFKRPKQ